MRVYITLLLLAAAGCAARADTPLPRDSGFHGTSSGAVVTWTSGSRLKAQYVSTADGARQPWGWFDAQIQVPCYFAQASDGQLRCVPSADAGVRPVSDFALGTVQTEL